MLTRFASFLAKKIINHELKKAEKQLDKAVVAEKEKEKGKGEIKMKPVQASTKFQAILHILLVAAQFAVMAFVKNPQTKMEAQAALVTLQGTLGAGLQSKQ